MLEYEISAQDVSKAFKLSLKLKQLKNSIRKGTGTLVGYLGEILAARALDGKRSFSYDYDIISRDKTYEVKTKECTSTPKDTYYCSVSAYNAKQECDYYIFVRIKKGFKLGWVLGYIKRDAFFKKAIFYKKGEKDPASRDGWTFKSDCYNIQIKELTKIRPNARRPKI